MESEHNINLNVEEEGPLWKLTEQERQQIILDYYPLVKTIAGRMIRRFPTNVDLDELVSEGILGLMDAMERFNPARGVPFKSYAEIRVRGAIVDALRHRDFVPRSVRRKWQALERERERLFLRLKRKPSREEMAASLGMKLNDYDAFCEDARIYGLISGDALLDEDSSETILSTVPAPGTLAEEDMITGETWEEVSGWVEKLPEKERLVVHHYYFQSLNLKQIGDQLGVTESRVCQLRGQAVRRIHLWMKEKEEEERLVLLESRSVRQRQQSLAAFF
ncbi:MAG TPA: FliA/WhiG family RNA polymerase sigma factor [Myxococcota bacterium]|nr:FliA/WhiG family RNA polymerase sigma factor [Myxococcota bacterium]HNH47195.1 FliA/WhiG family RNA polymerase sigma factor [Myxococcota bacterium]